MNKVLGSFKPDNLFAANQEFPAVADNLLIAAGQFLLRGSLVTKDGVLVDANDTEVYAVLAKDCDTTDGAQEAAVYLTGEFNIDEVKVNENVDNMFAVNVSARRTGIFLKPHLNMPPVAPMTLRFKFSKEGYSPVTAGVGTSGTWKIMTSWFFVKLVAPIIRIASLIAESTRRRARLNLRRFLLAGEGLENDGIEG